VQQDAHPEEVALALGLHRKTVYAWLAKYRDGGRGRCWPGRCRGGPPRLAPLQMRKLWSLIVGTDPRQLQFEFTLWTREMARELVRREFVSVVGVWVGRLLARMGLSPAAPGLTGLSASREVARRCGDGRKRSTRRSGPGPRLRAR